MTVDPRAILAAQNNADLYAVIFEAHSLAFLRHSFAFEARSSPPPYFSDLTITKPHYLEDLEPLLEAAQIRTEGCAGVKDSFDELNSDAHDLTTLFEACWIFLATPPKRQTPWRRIKTDDALAGWERSWAEGSPVQERQFPASLLARPDIAIFGAEGVDGYHAGCIANLSPECVGLSNFFTNGPTSVAFVEAIACLATFAPGKPIVGYASGEVLRAAKATGFDTTGRLRILVPKSKGQT